MEPHVSSPSPCVEWGEQVTKLLVTEVDAHTHTHPSDPLSILFDQNPKATGRKSFIKFSLKPCPTH